MKTEQATGQYHLRKKLNGSIHLEQLHQNIDNPDDSRWCYVPEYVEADEHLFLKQSDVDAYFNENKLACGLVYTDKNNNIIGRNHSLVSLFWKTR